MITMDAAPMRLGIQAACAEFNVQQPPVPVRWLNPTGYDDPPAGSRQRFFVITVPLVDFELDPVYPLTLLMSDGSLVQCERKFTSDKATAPWLTSFWIPRDLMPRAAYYHDSGCSNGGQWVCRAIPLDLAAQIRAGGRVELPRELFTFEATPRAEQDRMIYHTCQMDGVTVGRARAVYAGVRLGALVGIGRQDRVRE